LVDPQGSHWKTVADLPFGARGGMCANWRIGTAHFSQCGGAVFGPGISPNYRPDGDPICSILLTSPLSATRNGFRRSGAVTTRSIGCVASTASNM
jgi:hypothetical protein